jgi:hydrogenase nickel incorporation protein HypA/HybF
LTAAMHELAITRNIVAIVGEAAAGRHVRRVMLDVGKLSGVIPDAIAFCFDAVVQGTELDGARLDIRQIDGRARCEVCSAEFAIVTTFARCECGSPRIVLLAGEELDVRAMELEEAA